MQIHISCICQRIVAHNHPICSPFRPVKLSIGGSYEAVVCHVDNINKFHIQLLASSAE